MIDTTSRLSARSGMDRRGLSAAGEPAAEAAANSAMERHTLFEIEGEAYACPIDDMRRLLRLGDTRMTPANDGDTSSWRGVILDDGMPIAVLSVRRLWGLPPDPEGAGTEQCSLLIAKDEQFPHAFLVDSCLRVVEIPAGTDGGFVLGGDLKNEFGMKYESVISWNGRLLAKLRLADLLPAETRQTIEQKMTAKYRNAATESELQELRLEELKLMKSPDPGACVELADRYLRIGLAKESERLIQLAEKLESGDASVAEMESPNLMSGAVNPTMLIEVIQILNRTGRTGELSVQTRAQTIRVYFNEGQVVNAASSLEQPGLDAFRAALVAPSGRYSFEEKPDIDTETLIDQSVDTLLLESMQNLDETTFIVAAG